MNSSQRRKVRRQLERLVAGRFRIGDRVVCSNIGFSGSNEWEIIKFFCEDGEVYAKCRPTRPTAEAMGTGPWAALDVLELASAVDALGRCVR